MIQPTKLKMKGKSQKQIIDGLTARNLEMHMDNCTMAAALKQMTIDHDFQKAKAELMEEELLRNSLKLPKMGYHLNKEGLVKVDGEGNEKTD